MRVSGVLRDLAGRAISHGLIQLVAKTTSVEVLQGSSVVLKANEHGHYDFELLPGAYDVYVQPSRISDVNYMGETVISTDTPNGSLNSIVGITHPVLPPQVKQAVSAAKQAVNAANQVANDKGAVNDLVKQAQLISSELNATQNNVHQLTRAAGLSAARAADSVGQSLQIKEDVAVFVDKVKQDKNTISEDKRSVIGLKKGIELIASTVESHLNQTEKYKQISIFSADNAASHSQAAFRYMIVAGQYAQGIFDRAKEVSDAFAVIQQLSSDAKATISQVNQISSQVILINNDIEENRNAVIKAAKQVAVSEAKIKEKAEQVSNDTMTVEEQTGLAVHSARQSTDAELAIRKQAQDVAKSVDVINKQAKIALDSSQTASEQATIATHQAANSSETARQVQDAVNHLQAIPAKVENLEYQQTLTGNEIDWLKENQLSSDGVIAKANAIVSTNSKVVVMPNASNDSNHVNGVFTARWGDIRFVLPAINNTFISISVFLQSKTGKAFSNVIMSGFMSSNGSWRACFAQNIGNMDIPSIRFGSVNDNRVGIRPALSLAVPNNKTLNYPVILWATSGVGGLDSDKFDVSSAISLNAYTYTDIRPSTVNSSTQLINVIDYPSLDINTGVSIGTVADVMKHGIKMVALNASNHVVLAPDIYTIGKSRTTPILEPESWDSFSVHANLEHGLSQATLSSRNAELPIKSGSFCLQASPRKALGLVVFGDKAYQQYGKEPSTLSWAEGYAEIDLAAVGIGLSDELFVFFKAPDNAMQQAVKTINIYKQGF
ncbi:prophage tail fiber N-terminal domain-containing protein [Photobacterium damselae subsp. damselae]|uniref:prophage tail fiber N-terminal domain-containing protein n=1 Tax=Photobacterium damselae TaxID=38293 RepID=UPI001F32C341|nr:prophage tail fiber N-terminal domain-containing protein [Photobacterium damselae]UKA08872.1 prophage tail fiber N-terminal domain-containing protein [Photobacterium damselae subsp. damselae]UKA23925.1 prophage tail fiber N-terminal domain-containing protein [Photobacterium damselae subsp. damselae]